MPPPAVSPSADLLERARRVLPGGALATFVMPDEVAGVLRGWLESTGSR